MDIVITKGITVIISLFFAMGFLKGMRVGASFLGSFLQPLALVSIFIGVFSLGGDFGIPAVIIFFFILLIVMLRRGIKYISLFIAKALLLYFVVTFLFDVFSVSWPDAFGHSDSSFVVAIFGPLMTYMAGVLSGAFLRSVGLRFAKPPGTIKTARPAFIRDGIIGSVVPALTMIVGFDYVFGGFLFASYTQFPTGEGLFVKHFIIFAMFFVTVAVGWAAVSALGEQIFVRAKDLIIRLTEGDFTIKYDDIAEIKYSAPHPTVRGLPTNVGFLTYKSTFTAPALVTTQGKVIRLPMGGNYVDALIKSIRTYNNQIKVTATDAKTHKENSKGYKTFQIILGTLIVSGIIALMFALPVYLAIRDGACLKGIFFTVDPC